MSSQRCTLDRRKDFSNEMYVALQKSLETDLWLLLLNEGEFINDEQHESMKTDCVEMIKLTSAISKTSHQDE